MDGFDVVLVMIVAFVVPARAKMTADAMHLHRVGLRRGHLIASAPVRSHLAFLPLVGHLFGCESGHLADAGTKEGGVGHEDPARSLYLAHLFPFASLYALSALYGLASPILLVPAAGLRPGRGRVGREGSR